MTKERFEAKWEMVVVMIVCLGGGSALAYYGNRNDPEYLKGDFLIATIISAILIAFSFYWRSRTYLELRDGGRTLINRGYRDFGRDTIKVNDIKYIYRIPAFIVKHLGALMVIYIRDDEGYIRHSALREMNYSIVTLRSFLIRIKALNPSIELDPEYEALIDDTSDTPHLIHPTKNNVQDVEARLRAKGEKWSALSTAGKFINKF